MARWNLVVGSEEVIDVLTTARRLDLNVGPEDIFDSHAVSSNGANVAFVYGSYVAAWLRSIRGAATSFPKLAHRRDLFHVELSKDVKDAVTALA